MFGLTQKDLFIFLIVLVMVVVGYFYIDRDLAIYVHDLKGSEIKSFLSDLSFLGKSHWYIVPSLLLYIYFKRRKNERYAIYALYILFVNIAAGILVWLLKVPFGRLRPKMLFEHGEYGFEGLGIHYEYVSFPSGHSITILATATALALLFPKIRIPLILAGIAIAISRIAVSAHYFSDVLMGSYLGIMVALILYKYMIKDKDFDQNA